MGVLQINGGVGILGVHIVCVLLQLHLPPATATPKDVIDEESKSLWHQLAESLLLVDVNDRDRFLDYCLKRRIMCDKSHFQGPKARFRWVSGILRASKDRFWHSYACAYNRDVKECPVDGGWSSWSPWNRCTATCDAPGNQSRTRTCSNPVPVRGGERCQGSTMRARPCLGSCADPTKEGGLTEAMSFLKQVHEAYPDLMHECYNAHCTYGVVKRVVVEKQVRAKYWASLSCVKYGGACPVDGQWGEWSSWSRCSLRCGTGSRTRARTCDSPMPAFGGHPCRGEFHEQRSCIRRDCGPMSTETFTEWTKWTPCSVKCGSYGVQTSTRVCLRHMGCDLNGVLTPYVNRSRPCYPGDCPSQCPPAAGGWSQWTDWTACSAACGAGRQNRLRLCDSPFPTGGLSCMGIPLEFRLCKGDICAGQPKPPENTGYIRRARDRNEEVLIGKSDEFLLGPINPTLEALYTPWMPWSKCSASCGEGIRRRNRWCSAQSTPMPPCEGEVRQIQFCNVFVCPVAGGWGVWLPWTPCSQTCGKGKKQRYRECNNPLPQFGGSCDGDAKRVADCDMGKCPRVAGGTWSTWPTWTVCTASCNGGERTRTRTRQRMVPAGVGGAVDAVTSDRGSKEVLDCNAQPCPLDGSWAEWGEWSRCSVLCGIGRRTRDRTCTDPFPSFGGRACPGPGTDLAHCFAGPCKDAEDRAVVLGSTSWIRYAPRNRPTRFLTLYIHFKPMAPSGTILRRYRQCRSVFDDEAENGDDEVDDDDAANNKADRKADADEKCEMVVAITMTQAEIQLTVLARGAKLDIQSRVPLSLGSWHEIMVEVLKTGASLRVNDHKRLHANFSRPLVKDLDFDSYMTIGASDNNSVGMVGSISAISVNFRTQNMFAATDWEGQGTPVGRHAVTVQSINPSVRLPHFRGLYYSPLRMYHTERLAVRVTLALDKGEGLLLYARGQGPDTLLSLGLKHTRPVICIVCTRAVGNVCKQGDLLRLHQWYHMSLYVDETEAELRVDQGKALQLTCKGLPFRPRSILFVGGRSSQVWAEVQKETNYTDGFFGVLGTIVVNGRTVSFRQAVLLGRDERINPDGYSRASRITPVFEHKSSIVTLHCDIEKPTDPLIEVRVIWLFSDTILEPSEYVEIVKPVGMEKQVGTLQLQPGGNMEGIYACVVSRDGVLELNHVFPVFRHAAAIDLYEGNVEWLLLKLLLIFLPLLAMCCLLFRFRQRFIDLWKKLFGKKPEDPLLHTEPLDVDKPHKKHLHGSDPQSVWDNYLVEKGGETKRVSVVTFGPPEPKKLTVTPGVSSERPTVVSDGQVKLGENPRPTSTNQYPGEDPLQAMQLMQENYDPYAPLTPGAAYYDHETNPEEDGMNPYEPDPFDNVSHNKKPTGGFGGGIRQLASRIRNVSVPSRRSKKDSLILLPGARRGRPGSEGRRDGPHNTSQNRSVGSCPDFRGASYSGDRSRLVLRPEDPRSSGTRRDSRATRRDEGVKRLRVYHDDPSQDRDRVVCRYRDHSGERRGDSMNRDDHSRNTRRDYAGERRGDASKHGDSSRSRCDYSSDRRGVGSQSQSDPRRHRGPRQRQSVARRKAEYPAFRRGKFATKNYSALESDDDDSDS